MLSHVNLFYIHSCLVMLVIELPTSPTAFRGFLGLIGFYQKFIKGYAAIASPLTSLLRRDQFCWSPEPHTTFSNLQQAMVSAPILSNPNFSLPFTIEIDASVMAMRVVLLQEDHPIAFYSKVLCPRLQKASAYCQSVNTTNFCV